MIARVEHMLERLRTEPATRLLEIFSENLSQNIYRTARERLAAIPDGPYRKLRILKHWIAQDGGPPQRFQMKSLPYAPQNFRNITLLMLGELPVQRTTAFHKYRTSLGDFS